MAYFSSVFVSIDGPNGVGKTSVTKGVASRLHTLGFTALSTLEPTKTMLGQMLLEKEGTYDALTFACLIAADRYWHITNEIQPALDDGKIVITARYVESSLVLQRLDGLSLDFIWGLNCQILIPHISVMLMASPKELKRRLSERQQLSHYERMHLIEREVEYYEEAVLFLQSHKFNPVIVENENRNIDDTVYEICEIILNYNHNTS